MRGTYVHRARQQLGRTHHLLPAAGAECFFIKPIETMDDLIDTIDRCLEEQGASPETVTEALFNQPVRRLDEVKTPKALELA